MAALAAYGFAVCGGGGATVLGFGFGFGIPPPPAPPSPSPTAGGSYCGTCRGGGGPGSPTAGRWGHSHTSSWVTTAPNWTGGAVHWRCRVDGASFDASFHNLDLPNPSTGTPTRPRHPENDHGGAVFAGTQGEKRHTRRESAASNRSGAPTFALHTMIYSATTAQIWHEIQRQPANTPAEVVFRLQKDPSSTPYRYRGVPVFRVLASMSWFDAEIAIVDDYGRPWLPNWMQFAAALPELLAPGVSVRVELEEAGAVAWAPSASRTTKRVAALATTKATWPSTIAAIRAEWLPRRKTDRRAGYLAAADALQGAIDFDQARGAV